MLGTVAFVLALAACTVPNPGVNVILPPLLVITGHALLPASYTVSDLPAPVDQQVLLVPAGAARRAALASGRVLTSDGFFSVSVPVSSLPTAPAEYELQIYGIGGLLALAAPIALSTQSQAGSQDVSGPTTIVDLAARRAIASDRSVLDWRISQLAALPAVTAAAADLTVASWALPDVGPSSQITAQSSQQQTVAAAIAAVLQAAPG